MTRAGSDLGVVLTAQDVLGPSQSNQAKWRSISAPANPPTTTEGGGGYKLREPGSDPIFGASRKRSTRAPTIKAVKGTAAVQRIFDN